ncbi:MAG: hypothetical protein QOG70_2722 [Solirubrobacteraceae bacterium]|jgi:hypothetical protein|nr:hypothetical protein [Solirubrobacteraceae bacterium]
MTYLAAVVEQVAHDAPHRLGPEPAAVQGGVEQQVDRGVPDQDYVHFSSSGH